MRQHCAGILGTADDEIVCSTENAVLTRSTGTKGRVDRTISFKTNDERISKLGVPVRGMIVDSQEL